MLLSLALIWLLGLILAAFFQKIKLPRILGMLLAGMLLGPYVLDYLDDTMLLISSDLRQLALLIILIKAGLSLDLKDLKKVGKPAFLLAFLPATFEIITYFIVAPMLFDITAEETLLMGAVLSAVSPAIVVPRMVHLIEEGYGTKKSIPQMILAAASCDDVYVLVLFSTFLTVAQGNVLQVMHLLEIPISIVIGVIVGAITGYALVQFLENCHRQNKSIKNSVKVVIILALSCLLFVAEEFLFIPYSGLLSVVSMACLIKLRSTSSVTKRVSLKFSKIWIAAELLLFVLVGAAVDVRYLFSAGINVILLIFIALAIRSIGVYLCLLKSDLNSQERMFCIFAYLPKATVQAAIGAIPLSLGLASGQLILTVAILGIIITAPLGAILIDNTYRVYLKKEQ